MPAEAKKCVRSAKIDRSKIDPEKRTVELSFSSEEPVERWGENEVLGHAEGEYDFSRFKNGDHPLLLGHDEYDPTTQIGVIESARVDSADKKGRAVVRFGKSAQAQEIFQDVQDGIRQCISVGYERIDIVRSDKAANGMVTTRYRWAPTHIAVVPVPADTTVGVGREKPAVDGLSSLDASHIYEQLSDEQKRSMKILLEPASPTAAPGAPAIDEKKLRSDSITEERTRISEIERVADELIKERSDMTDKIRSMASEARTKGESLGDFQVRAMKEVIGAKPAKKVTLATMGYDEQDRRNYSLLRAFKNCCIRKNPIPDPDTLEGDVHVRMAKEEPGFAYQGFLVPPDANISPRSLSRSQRRRMQRDLQVNVFGQGGATVETSVITPIIEILRNEMRTEQLGIVTMSGLQGNIAIPRQTAAATALSVPEIGPLATSTQVLDQITLQPHRVGATNQYSKQLLIQSSMDVEQFVRDDLLKVIAEDWDRIVLNGSGAGDEATGILNTPGIGSITFGASATWANIVLFETTIAALNAPKTNRGYLTDSTAKGRLKTLAKLLVGATTVAAVPLWEKGMGAEGDGEMNGYIALDSQNVPNHQLIFGAWSEVILGLWGGYDVVLDPYTLAKNAEVVITVNTWGDVALRHPQSFCVSADSAAQ